MLRSKFRHTSVIAAPRDLYCTRLSNRIDTQEQIRLAIVAINYIKAIKHLVYI